MRLDATLVLAAFVATSAGAAGGEGCPEDAAWPAEDWPTAVEAVRAARPAEVKSLERYAFTLDGLDAARRGIRTDGLVIVHRGLVTFERYGRGFGPGTRHLGWSVSKSVTSALAGVAVARGVLRLGDSICRYLAAPQERCGITVRHLLEWTSGLDWTESYEGQAHQASSVLAMLYGVGRRDMAGFVLAQGARDAPGARWSYSSGDSLLLAAVAGRAMAAAGAGAGWPWTELFDPLGMRSAVLERDAAGTLVGSSHFYATPRDMARFGWLFLEDGCWRGRRILPAGWVRQATEVSPPLRAGSPPPAPDAVPGRQWWLNRPAPKRGRSAPWPGVPEDAYAARGHWGQAIVVIPSLQMVIVRVGDDRDEGALGFARLLRLAIAAGKLP